MGRILTLCFGRLARLAAVFPRQIQTMPEPAPTTRLSRDEIAALFAQELGYR
jgi:hypothetical protein